MAACAKFYYVLLAISAVVLVNQVSGRSIDATETKNLPQMPFDRIKKKSDLLSFKKKAKPTPGTAPLDPNETIHNELDSLNQILGIVGGGASGLVMGLTGISITDCAQNIKGQDLNTLTCPEFIDQLSKCDSLMNVKDLLQAAKKKYRKNKKSKKPCFE